MNRLFRRRDEQGVALVTAIMVGFVASMFISTMMYVAFHNQTSSAKNRSWGQALHVAESGVHQAIAYLQNSSGVVPSTTQTGTTNEGTYQYRVVAQTRNRYQIDAVGSVGTASSTMATRRLRVTMAPPISFRYALFSLSDVTTKNNNVVCGDIWANTYVEVYNGDSVLSSTNSDCPTGSSGNGAVTAATSYISMSNNSKIEGDAWSGGYDSSGYGINMSNGASVGGNAMASSTLCTTAATNPNYKIGSSGSVGGTATAWGTITASVTGARTTKCTDAPGTKTVPPFVFNTANYPAGTVHQYTFPADYTAFNTYIAANKTNLSGVFYIVGGGASYPIDLNGTTVSGDLTVYAKASPTASPIDMTTTGMGSTGSTDKIVVLATEFAAPASSCTTNGGNPSDCAIGFKNNFSMPSSLSGGSNTAVLLYAPYGPIAFKNSADFHGAVFANNIQVKNNMNVTYDPRLQQIVGFGTSTLDISNWEECDPGVVTTTACG